MSLILYHTIPQFISDMYAKFEDSSSNTTLENSDTNFQGKHAKQKNQSAEGAGGLGIIRGNKV